MALHPKIKELQVRAGVINYVDTPKNAKSSATDDGIIKGYLIVWGVKDDRGTKMLKGCCSKSIADHGPDGSQKYQLKFLWQHDQKDPLSNFLVLREDDYGLYFEAKPDDVPNGERAVKQVRSGTLNQFSVGFKYIWDKVDYDEEDDALILREIKLFEGSIVTIPSNMETYAIRSMEDYEAEKMQLQADTEDFLKGLPHNKQLELRQLITRNISLSKVEPDELERRSLDVKKPTDQGIDYTYLLTNLNS